MKNLELLRETKEYGVEAYAENFEEKTCGCSKNKKGIEILKKEENSEE